MSDNREASATCEECGAVVADEFRHRFWHDGLRRALRAAGVQWVVTVEEAE